MAHRGRKRYPEAKTLQILADGGGSNRRPGAARSWATTVAAAGDDGGPPGEIAGRVCVLRKSAEATRLAHQKIRRDAARKGTRYNRPLCGLPST